MPSPYAAESGAFRDRWMDFPACIMRGKYGKDVVIAGPGFLDPDFWIPKGVKS